MKSVTSKFQFSVLNNTFPPLLSPCLNSGPPRFPRLTCLYWLWGQGLASRLFRDVTNHAPRPRLFRSDFHWAQRKMTCFSNECENSFLVSDSAHVPFHTVKCWHWTGRRSRRRRKGYFWIEGDLKVACTSFWLQFLGASSESSLLGRS